MVAPSFSFVRLDSISLAIANPRCILIPRGWPGGPLLMCSLGPYFFFAKGLEALDCDYPLPFTYCTLEKKENTTHTTSHNLPGPKLTERTLHEAKFERKSPSVLHPLQLL